MDSRFLAAPRRSFSIAAIFAASLTVVACGGGGGSSTPPPPAEDEEAPTATVNFPSSGATTLAPAITVRGTAVDAFGSAITELTVNGVSAESSDDFATWVASVPLSSGMNTIIVTTSDSEGNRDTEAARLTLNNEAPLLNAVSVVTQNTRVIALDAGLGALVEVNPSSGTRSILSGLSTGAGDPFVTPTIIVSGASSNTAYVLDGQEIIEVDLNTGNRSNLITAPAVVIDMVFDPSNLLYLLLQDSTGFVIETVDLSTQSSSPLSPATELPALELPRGLILDTSTTPTRLLVTDTRINSGGTPTIIVVDTNNGSRAEIPNGANLGPQFVFPTKGAVVNAQNEALIIDPAFPAIFAVDLGTGARRVVTGDTIGAGPEINLPAAISHNATTTTIIADPGLNALVELDLATGDRTELSRGMVSDGTPFNTPFSIAVDETNDRLLVTDIEIRSRCSTDSNDNPVNACGRVLAINPDSGERSVISDPNNGSGTELQFPLSLNADPNRNQAYLVDADTGSVVTVDLANGNRTQVNTSLGGGNCDMVNPVDEMSPLGLGYQASAETLIVSVVELPCDGSAPGSELFTLPLATSTPTALATPALQLVQSISVDDSDDSIYVAGTLVNRLARVAPTGGGSFLDSPLSTDVDPNLSPVQGLDIMNGNAVIVDSVADNVVSIDLTADTRRIISGAGQGAGLPIRGPSSVAYSPTRDVLYVVDIEALAILAIDPVSGDRVIISR